MTVAENRLFCSIHKEQGMIDIAHKKCNTRPHFNYETEKIGIFCNQHKLINMVNVTDKKCNYNNCNILPGYNYETEKRGLYCNQHKLINMVDVTHKKCKTDYCDTRISNKYYKGYCVRCFINLFPNNKISRRYKIKENHVVDYIKNNINITESKDSVTYDKAISEGCSKKRPDIFIDQLTHSIIIEVDENQHMNYTCENKRVMELFTDLGNRPLVVIKFNPDSYINKNGKKIESCFNSHTNFDVPVIKNISDWNNRLKTLKDAILDNINNIPKKEITIQKLYYNSKL